MRNYKNIIVCYDDDFVGAEFVMKKDNLKQVASSFGEYIHNKSSDDIFIDTGACSKL